MANMKNAIKTGDKFDTKYNGPLTVIDGSDSKRVVCKFDNTGTVVVVQAPQIRKGLVNDVMVPNATGAFIGVGKYTPKDPAYIIWNGIFYRIKNKRSGYEDASIDPRWYNFQTFAEWYEINSKNIPSPNVDKDILEPGNKVYSPEKCCVIPADLNKAFVGTTRNGEPAKGAYFSKGKWAASVNEGGNVVNLGRFANYDDAHAAYKYAKETYIKSLANKYKDFLDHQIFNLLLNYSVR